MTITVEIDFCSKGCIETKLLYEEDDGVWLPLQGIDRKKYGSSKELKVGIAYDGVLWSGGKNGKARRELHNKVAYTGFDSAAEYRERKAGLVASRFDFNGIELRIRNGDGAGWVQSFGNADINVLDVFHRNKALLTHVQHPGLRKLLMKQLYDKNISNRSKHYRQYHLIFRHLSVDILPIVVYTDLG